MIFLHEIIMFMVTVLLKSRGTQFEKCRGFLGFKLQQVVIVFVQTRGRLVAHTL